MSDATLSATAVDELPLDAPPASDYVKRAIYIIVGFAIAGIFSMPIVWSVANSFKLPAETLSDPVRLIPRAFSLDNYRNLDTVGDGLWSFVGNSL